MPVFKMMYKMCVSDNLYLLQYIYSEQIEGNLFYMWYKFVVLTLNVIFVLFVVTLLLRLWVFCFVDVQMNIVYPEN